MAVLLGLPGQRGHLGRTGHGGHSESFAIDEWAGFAVLGLVSMLTFRKPIYQRLRGHTPELRIGPAGTVLILPTSLAPGESCQIEHSGSHWTAQNEYDAPILAGSRVRISEVRGLTLLVRPDL